MTPAEFAFAARNNPEHTGPRQCLLDAAELLERSDIARRCFARDANGERVMPSWDTAVTFSVFGALLAVGDATNRALELLLRQLRFSDEQLWEWNNAATKEQVAAALRAAAGGAP